mmetsp:Transcript_28070/g.34659  ORF Transcript_28070/g.34659 Transcript_28070/m.34659 type:complete len:276 (+) Transcript_28070:180-1007(+)
MTQNHTHLIHLCKAGKWNALIKVIRSTPRAVLQELTFSSGLNLFAIAVSTSAPEEVVRELLTLCPQSTVEVDLYGATPLHLACLNGTTPEVVSMICQHDNGQSARILDKDDSTPLHNAVEYGCMVIKKRHGKKTFADVESKSKTSSMPSSSENSIQTEHEEYMSIIKILCNAYPGQVHTATKGAKDTPLDIPHVVLLHNNIPREGRNRILEIYSVLQEISVQFWRSKKRQWELEGHSVLIDSQETSSLSQRVIPSLADSSLTSASLNEEMGPNQK